MSDERFLVTGALGCVGAWTVRALVREGTPVIGFDLGTSTRRLMSDETELQPVKQAPPHDERPA